MTWEKLINEEKGKLNGKIWAVLGDSNSGNSYAIPYHQLLKVSEGVNVFNYARGGAGWIAKSSDGSAPNLIEQLASAPAEVDIITAMAGGNDYSMDYPLGQLGDNTMDTFYGALDLTMKAMIEKYPMKKIAIFTQMRRRTEAVRPKGTSVEKQVNATIDVAKKYGLPVLNLYHHGNMYPWNDAWYTECMMEDGVHLIAKGQEILTNKVKGFLESL